jgi:3-dehydroquinate synthase
MIRDVTMLKPSEPLLMPASTTPTKLDISFSVPFVHRLRETTDVGGDCFDVLAELLLAEDDPGNKPRVLVWLESSLLANNESAIQLSRRIASLDAIQCVCEPIALDGGEAIKNSPDFIDTLLSTIQRFALDRRSYIIAVGGGALLDAVGYAASIAHRGIRLVRIPTTTLAQADSGVGVKNAVNYFGKKNWVGTFAVPWGVINDVQLLHTLPDRDFRCGFSEAVKVSLLKSPEQFAWLCTHATAIGNRDMNLAVTAIRESCRAHLRHITEGGDPFEMQAARPLDFGHWSAHKLEPLTQYRLRHGEAVGIGVAIDSWYSALVHGFPIRDAERVCDLLNQLGLPLWDDALYPLDRLLDGLEEFRQHLGGQLTITMLNGIGHPINVHQVDVKRMAQAIAKLKSYA